MMYYNYEVIANTTTLGTMFFASTIFITLVITRYATLAKLIRDSRTEIEKGGLKFKNPEEIARLPILQIKQNAIHLRLKYLNLLFHKMIKLVKRKFQSIKVNK